jgi:hypothetical protein
VGVEIWADAREHTFMKNVAHGAIVYNHNFAQVWLDLSQVFDVCPIPESAMLPIIPPSKVFALYFKPVDDRVGVLLHRCRKNNQIVPFTDLVK